jgi:chromosome segregation ATPase
MPDTPIAMPERGPYDPSVEQRFSRLEEDVRDLKAIAVSIDGRFANFDARFTNLESRFDRFEARTTRVEEALIELKTMFAATLPHLATKADLADVRTELKEDIAEIKVSLAEKPGRTYMWGILAVLLTAYACGLAGLAVLR